MHRNRGMQKIVGELCRAEPGVLLKHLGGGPRAFATHLLIILAGTGAYGVTIGLWRAPLQAGFTAVKFPILILLTTLANAALNGMLAQLMGLPISFRRSAMAILTSFSIFACVLGSLSPVTFFMTLNTPPLAAGRAVLSHSTTLLAHVGIIAFAGVVANTALLRLLVHLCGNATRARKILFSWLLGNMFLGCQLSWILRPFIGSPHLPVQFLRPDAFHGNFYESVLRAVTNLMGGG